MRAEFAFHYPSVRGEPLQRRSDDGDSESQPGGGLGGGERPVGSGEAGDEVAQRVSDRLDEGQRHAHRQRDADGVAQPGGILHRGIPLGTADVDLDGAVGALERHKVCGGIGNRSLNSVGHRLGDRSFKPCRGFQAGGDLPRGQRAQQPEQVRNPLQPADLPIRGEALQFLLRVVNDLGVEQFTQLDPAQEFVEQGRIQRQRRSPALGQRGIAFVEELRDVAEQQGLGEGGGLLRSGLQDPQLAPLDGRGDVLECREVVDVLETFPDRLEDDREGGVFPRHVQQLGGALPLLPQGLPFARVLPGQQQCPGGTLTEPGREEGAAADLRRHDLFKFLRVEHEQLSAGGLVVHHGHTQYDAVIGRHRGAVHPVTLVQALPDCEGPRRVHRHAEGAVQYHPPVAEFVVEALHHKRGVAGDHVGGQLLLGEVLDEVVGGEIVQAAGLAAFRGRSDVGRGQFADKRAQGAAQVHRPAEGVALPERELPRLAEGGRDQDPVMGDVLNLPTGGAQGEHVTDPGLVHHFFVEFADPAATLGCGGGRAGRPAVAARGTRGAGAFDFRADDVDAKKPAVRNGAAGGDSQPLGSGPALDGAGIAVPDNPGPQFRELVRGIPAGEQVQCGLEGGAGERGERRRPADRGEPFLHFDGLQCRGRDGLLGQDVQRIRGDVEAFDFAGQHPLHRDGGVHQICTVLGEEHTLGDFPDLMTGAAHPLEPAGHGRRGLNLHHEVNCPHVDAQFKGGRGNNAAQPAGFQVVLDQGPLVLGDRAVVGAGQDRIGAGGAAGLGHHVRRRRGGSGRPDGGTVPAAAGGHQLPLGVDLVEPGREAFGEPAGIGEHNGGLVGQHQVHYLLLHMRPDRCLGLQPGCRPGVERAGSALQVGHVRHRDGDRQVPGLFRRRSHNFHRGGAGEELCHQLLGFHGGREPDPLGGFREQRVEAFQGHCQVGTAFSARDGVDLVDDDGVHLAEGLPGLGREHQEEGFGGGDEDVRGVAQQRSSLRGRGVTGPDAHGDQRCGQVKAFGGLGDADQRCAQVAFDVDAERLERRDVEHPGFAFGRLSAGAFSSVKAGQPLGLSGGRDEQAVECPEKGCECFAGTGGGDDEGMRAGGNRVPGPFLGGCGRGEGAQEPVPGWPAEPVHGLRRECAASELLPLHSSIMPYGTDSHGRPRHRLSDRDAQQAEAGTKTSWMPAAAACSRNS
ncbi:hypothetical protein BJQ89_00757 [Arthrobacter sp. ES1]|nr:hypothetical protein [Arthrobacter sp. ES1]